MQVLFFKGAVMNIDDNFVSGYLKGNTNMKEFKEKIEG